jgi:hypothetical protein
MAGGIYTWIGRDIFQMEDRRRTAHTTLRVREQYIS